MNYGIKNKELLAIINTLNEFRAELTYLLKFEVVIN